MYAIRSYYEAGYETGTMLTDGIKAITEVCVGGNAIDWWADPDVKAMYDDVAYFNQALTADEVAELATMNYASAVTSGAGTTDAVPTTGDTMPIVAIAICAVAAFAGIVVTSRKKTTK